MGYKFWNYARRIDANTIKIYTPDGVAVLQLHDATANTATILGLDATLKTLKIFANGTDTTPSIVLAPSTANSVVLTPSSARAVFINGNLKYGTYNATGDVACNGYIEMLDAGGNTRKLMITA